MPKLEDSNQPVLNSMSVSQYILNNSNLNIFPGPSGLQGNFFKSESDIKLDPDDDDLGRSCELPSRLRSYSWTSRSNSRAENILGLSRDLQDVDIGTTSTSIDESDNRASEEQIQEDNQLTITSNGSKIVAGTVLLHQSKKPESNGIELALGGVRPHTITCRPISESSSLAQLSLASSLSANPNSPMCKICHLNARDGDPLISPCKCAGTMQYIHCGCLMRWLEISSKKSRKPLACELCQYQYHWHKKFKLHHWQFPHCSNRDKLLHVLFLVSVAVMMACAIVTVICFKHDRGGQNRTRGEMSKPEIVTLIAGVLFFLAFFAAMYVEVRARNTVYKLFLKFIYLNQQWFIDEYEKKEILPLTPSPLFGDPIDV